jgi:hypothetical protein
MVVTLKNGLGNQMFQYAFGRSVSLAKGEDLFFTRDLVDADPKRCYALGVFDVPIKFVSDPKIAWFTESPHSFNPNVYRFPHGIRFDGQWQTEKYFNVPLVRSIFSIRKMSEASSRVADEIRACGDKSAFIHVRRTDYLTSDGLWFHGGPSMEYYNMAQQWVYAAQEGVKFFIFSDDPEWCKTAFPGFRVVDHNRPGGRMFGSEVPGTEHEDLWLMSLCRHAVIANSSFSWWGAWLGDDQPNRTVIAPKTWVGPGYRALDTKDIVPDRWVKIE